MVILRHKSNADAATCSEYSGSVLLLQCPHIVASTNKTLLRIPADVKQRRWTSLKIHLVHSAKLGSSVLLVKNVRFFLGIQVWQ